MNSSAPERLREEIEPPVPELLAKDGVYHCCLACGWTPIEGMRGYLAIHGWDATCLVCDYKLVVSTNL